MLFFQKDGIHILGSIFDTLSQRHKEWISKLHVHSDQKVVHHLDTDKASSSQKKLNHRKFQTSSLYCIMCEHFKMLIYMPMKVADFTSQAEVLILI